MRKFVLFLSLLPLACQPEPPAPSLWSQTLPILGGVPDPSPGHQGVVMMRNSQGWCSGTLVAPMVVLTAAHCADAGEAGDYTVYIGDEYPGDAQRQVQEVIYHPQFSYEDTGNLAFDIAMLRLDRPAPDWAQPIPYLPESLALTPLDLGENLDYVGFGLNDQGTIGTKLKVTVSIDFVCNNAAGCDNQVDGVNYHAYANTVCHGQAGGTQGTCSGDSGGPGFIVREGQEYVAAVTSYGDMNCHYYGCSTIVSAYEDFINDFVGSFSVAGQPCTNPVECLSGFCRDGVCCESACDEPCMSCNHPRRPGECDVADDGYPCPDGDACNGEEYCISGACTGSTPIDCTSGDPCLTGSCRPDRGCVFQAVQDGEPCDNGDACDGEDQCRAGECLPVGVPQDCADEYPCTIDSCDPDLGCLHEDAADGTPCADDDLCNGEEVCSGGSCAAPGPLDCDDDNACTVDSCDPDTGCEHRRLEDGQVCGDCRKCDDGLCLPDKNCGDSGCGCKSTPAATVANGVALLLGLLFIGLCIDRGRTRG